MKIVTRDFGELDIDGEEVISFCQGLYGFEQYKSFVLLYDDEIGLPFTWLQSTEEQSLCFVLADAAEIGFADYKPSVTAETRVMLGLGGDEPVYRLIMTIPEAMEDATVNLKSPIVLNTKNKIAAQVILEEKYPIRARLVPHKEGAR